MNESNISISSNKCKLACNKNLQEIIEWLGNEYESMEYGEIGFSLVVHQSKIIRIKQLKELSYKL